MTIKKGMTKASGTLFLVFLLISSAAVFMALKVRTDAISRKKVPGSSIIFIPSGKYLKYATFGFSSLAADFIYLWAIQYYSTYEIKDRFFYLDHIFSIINDLDPRYTDPYEIGSLIATQEARDPKLALKILDRGLERNPDNWFFPFEAAHVAQMSLKDLNLARSYYEKAMAIPGAPELIKRNFANIAYKLMDYKTAWEMWKEVYETTANESIKNLAMGHLYQIKSAADVQTIKEALAKFKEKAGRLPSDLGQLVKAGILGDVPKDMDGKDYIYDALTGAVKPPTISWKR